MTLLAKVPSLAWGYQKKCFYKQRFLEKGDGARYAIKF